MNKDMKGPPVTKQEFGYALNSNRATGMANISAKILKDLGEITKEYLYKFIKGYYKMGKYRQG